MDFQVCRPQKIRVLCHLKYWSEWKDSQDFQNCPLYRGCGCPLSGVPLYMYSQLRDVVVRAIPRPVPTGLGMRLVNWETECACGINGCYSTRVCGCGYTECGCADSYLLKIEQSCQETFLVFHWGLLHTNHHQPGDRNMHELWGKRMLKPRGSIGLLVTGEFI